MFPAKPGLRPRIPLGFPSAVSAGCGQGPRISISGFAIPFLFSLCSIFRCGADSRPARRRVCGEIACLSRRPLDFRSVGSLRIIKLLHRRDETEDILTIAVGNDVSTVGFIRSGGDLIWQLVDKNPPHAY